MPRRPLSPSDDVASRFPVDDVSAILGRLRRVSWWRAVWTRRRTVAITGNAQRSLRDGHQPLEGGTSAVLLTSSHHGPTFSRTGSINRISPPFRCPFPLAVRAIPVGDQGLLRARSV